MSQDKPLKILAKQIADANRANGWFEVERYFGDDIALLHSEVSEAYEEFRSGHSPDDYYYKRLDGSYSHIPSDPGNPTLHKPEGVPSELADIIIRALDTCYRHGIDIDLVLAEKLAYNATRGYRHGGKVV